MAKENTFSRHRQRLVQHGIPHEEFDQVKAENPSLSNSDIVWGLFNKALALNAGKWHSCQMIYHAMALFVKAEGRDPYQYSLQRSICELNDFKFKSTFDPSEVMVEVIGEDTCEHCKKINGKKYSFRDYETQIPIPGKVCTNNLGVCRSCVGFSFKETKPAPSKSGCLGVVILLATFLTVTIVTVFVNIY